LINEVNGLQQGYVVK